MTFLLFFGGPPSGPPYGARWPLQTYARFKVDKVVEVALTYCHLMRDTVGEVAWLTAERNLTGEDRLLNATSRLWRSRHCLLRNGTVLYDLHLDTPSPLASKFASLDFVAQYAPRVRTVVVAGPGYVFYPLTQLTATGEPRQVLVDHNALCTAVDEYGILISERMAQMPEIDGRPLRPPCICPVHFGFVGSGLHFLHPSKTMEPSRRYNNLGRYELRCRWRILVNATNAGHYTSSERSWLMGTSETFSSKIAQVERALLGERLREPVTFDAYDVLRGFDVTPLLQDVDEASRWWTDLQLPIASQPGGDPDSEAEQGAGDLMLARRLVVGVDMQNYLVRTSPQDQHDTYLPCFNHCQRLEAAILGDAIYNATFAPLRHKPPVESPPPKAADDAAAAAAAVVPYATRGMTEQERRERDLRLEERLKRRSQDL